MVLLVPRLCSFPDGAGNGIEADAALAEHRPNIKASRRTTPYAAEVVGRGHIKQELNRFAHALTQFQGQAD